MGNAAGQGADRLHSFRFFNLLLKVFLLGNISENTLDGGSILKSDH